MPTGLFSERYDELRMIVCMLPPHSAHRLQPLDIGFFNISFISYTVVLTETAVLCERLVSVDASFLLLFKAACKKATHETLIRWAFPEAGLIPHNPEVVIRKVFPKAHALETARPMPPETPPPSSRLQVRPAQETLSVLAETIYSPEKGWKAGPQIPPELASVSRRSKDLGSGCQRRSRGVRDRMLQASKGLLKLISPDIFS